MHEKSKKLIPKVTHIISSCAMKLCFLTSDTNMCGKNAHFNIRHKINLQRAQMQQQSFFCFQLTSSPS